MNLVNKTDKELRKIALAIEKLQYKNKYNSLEMFFPDIGPYSRDHYRPAIEFMKQGKTKSFRVFAGGNRSGKSFTMAYELTCHALLQYPDWWEGHKFKKIHTIWLVAESGALFMHSMQKTLFGRPGEETGTGLIPLAENNNGVGLVDWKAMPGNPGAIGSAIIKNSKGKYVSLIIKTNEMTREQFQAAEVDLLCFDEEPKYENYTEALMRLMGTTGRDPGIAMFAFTPLKGLSDVVLDFLPNGEWPEHGSPIESPDNYICRVEWQDVPHLSEADKKKMLAKIPVNERDARTKGIPSLGSGRIYPVDEDFIVVPTFEVPDYWPRAIGLDFASPNGFTAAVWIAQDPNTKIKYVYAEYKRSKVIDEMHIEAIKARGKWIRIACDPHSGVRDNGTMRSDFYRSKGLDLTNGENALIGGISHNLSQFETGMKKVMAHCEEYRKEYRIYRYDTKDPNKPAPKQKDHLMDADRYVESIFDWIATSKQRYEDDQYPSKKKKINSGITGYGC